MFAAPVGAAQTVAQVCGDVSKPRNSAASVVSCVSSPFAAAVTELC